MPAPFEPTRQAALAAIAAVRPAEYARTRNRLDGAVSRLSPYITHGIVTLPEVLEGVRARHAVPGDHKFVYELGWREFFHHVHAHEGERIFASLHEGPLPESAYERELPQDIRRGATGVPVVDMAVRELYATGWLHNHARMWLASYVVHLRKVHWRAGADWLYGHLIDGDLASNHLSWQWVAGTGSHKPYLFNAENVARFAPRSWHSEGTPVDQDYESLEDIARSAVRVPVDGGPGVDEPPLMHTPPPGIEVASGSADRRAFWIDAHSLRAAPSGIKAQPVFDAAFHRRWAWSERRWQFVANAMAQIGGTPVWHEGPPPADVSCHDMPRLFRWPTRRARSFSRFWAELSPLAS